LNVSDRSTVQTVGVATDSAEEHVGKIPLPILVGSLVNEEGHPPWATRFIIGVRADQHSRQSGEIAVIDVTLGDHPRQDEIARLIGLPSTLSIPVAPTRAHHLAIARLVVRTGHFPSHSASQDRADTPDDHGDTANHRDRLTSAGYLLGEDKDG